MSQIRYYTEEGLKKLQEELHQLEIVERPSISRQIAEARDKGDLSENAEYDAAKEAQGLLELKIGKLKQIVSNARVIDEEQMTSDKILILSKIRLMNISMKKEFNYQLVAESEANLREGKISVDSPIGKGLLGKKVGDIDEIQVPNGIMKFEVLEITR